MRRPEPSPRAFQAPVDVHASADGQMYMFPKRTDESAGSSEDEELSTNKLRTYHRLTHVHRRGQGLESDLRQGDHPDGQVFTLQRRIGEPAGSSDDEDLGAMELRPFHRNNNVHSHVHGLVLERQLQQGDNLNKLALQYGCQVAEIKRLNNLIQEQDLFALKSIKIPIQKHSFLTEEFGDARTTQCDAPPSPLPETPARAPPPVREATDFLMEVDSDMVRLIQEDDELLEAGDRRERPGRGRGVKGHGADWGIHWWNAVIAMLLIGIALPLFYIIYFKTRPSDGGSVLNAHGTNSSGTEGVALRPVQEPG
uniref:LysM and putative peptidoglycan-binding domain-containing protein 4 n=1 Tax=Neogobius melanostomus TaxID=47308 RepID=A0A8C6TRQ3_9GOBI